MKKHRSKEKDSTIDKNYENLANAIVLQAAEDYRRVLRWLSNAPNDRTARGEKQHLERFFRGKWFSTLTNIEPERLIERLKSEVE